MLLLFTTFTYLPNFVFSRNTAHLMMSQKNNVIWPVSTISPTGYNIIWYSCDERKLFFPFRFEVYLSGGRSGHLGTFYFLLNRTDWSWWFCYFIFFEYFSKDSYMPKNVVSKNKANSKLMLLVHIGKNYQGIIKINITKVVI